jgi:hypothetical protein
VRRVVTHTGVTDTPTRAPKPVPDVPDESLRNRYATGIYRRPIIFPTFPTLPTLASDRVPEMWTAVRHVYLNSGGCFLDDLERRPSHRFEGFGPALTLFVHARARDLT